MNVLFVLLTTVSAGDSCCGAPAHHAAPSCCDSCCGTVVECCHEKPRRGFFSRKRSCEVPCCDTCSTPCCAPAPTCGSCCEVTCCEAKPRRSFFRRKSKECCEVPCCDSCGCGAPVGHPIIAPAQPGAQPQQGPAPEAIKKMPKPADEKKIEADKPKGASLMPQAPVTPTGVQIETGSKNPF